jgi:CHAT domain-containing protein
MVKLCLLLSVVTAILLVGSRPSQPRHLPAKEVDVVAIRNSKYAHDAYARGEFKLAAARYRQGYESALSRGARDSGLSCLNNAAGAELAAADYRAALQTFLSARRLAEQLGNRPVQAVIWLNLSSLYLALRNDSEAEQAALRASQVVHSLSEFPYRAEITAQLASFRVRDGDYKKGLLLFEDAIDQAADAGNLSLRATLNERAGLILLERGAYVEAEPYINEAFRLRVLSHDRNRRSSYVSASRLKLAQGYVSLASALIDQASALPIGDARPAMWLEYYQLGQVRIAQKNLPQARTAFAQALEAADAWHAGAALSDQARMASDIGTHELMQAYVEADVDSGPAHFADAFLAAERDRAAGLRRVTQAVRRSAANTAEFEQILDKLREAQTARLSENGAQQKLQVEELRARLSELEARSYLALGIDANITERTASLNTLRNIQDRIRPEEALLSFYRGTKETFLWAVTNSHFEFHRLPDGGVLAALAARLAASVEGNAADRETLSRDLYRKLFGQLSQAVQKQERWIVTADDALFAIPFPALIAEKKITTKSGGDPVYLVELHSVERIPSAWMLTRGGARVRQGVFVGIGDGIYNRADPRWHGAGWHGAGDRSVPLELARLAASGPEVVACGRQWADRAPTVFLIGARATRREVQMAVSQRPAVLHFAAHVLYPEGRRDEAVIDLGLNRRGQAELLTREDVANLDTPGSIVVMSGCSSGAAGAVAGAGILGLSRAWMMAGASTVVGSLWPTADDSGRLFQRFYAHLRASIQRGPVERAAADALQAAQLDMVRSGTWRSEPRYWSAFYMMGKD